MDSFLVSCHYTNLSWIQSCGHANSMFLIGKFDFISYFFKHTRTCGEVKSRPFLWATMSPNFRKICTLVNSKGHILFESRLNCVLNYTHNVCQFLNIRLKKYAIRKTTLFLALAELCKAGPVSCISQHRQLTYLWLRWSDENGATKMVRNVPRCFQWCDFFFLFFFFKDKDPDIFQNSCKAV